MTTTATDALDAFVSTFGDALLADDLGDRLTCAETIALADVLASNGNDGGAAAWRAAHQRECDSPELHQAES